MIDPEELCQIFKCENYSQHYYFISWVRGGLEQRCHFHFQSVSRWAHDLVEMTASEAVAWKIMHK